ncbi:MAG: hypothetical protein ACRDJH_07080 [Thermomicrobiales bacterium]
MTTAEQDATHQERDDRDVELARLRERVAFYESFDRVIAENVARSGDLLRQAMETRSSATSDLTTAQEETERQRLQELSRQRGLLSALLDDVIQLQGQAERLARRVADALDEVESELPIGEFPAPRAPVTATTDETPRSAQPVDPDSPAVAIAEPTTGPRMLTVLAHCLPDAAAAKSLREHLAGLAQVSAVEPREFAEGVLRLDVTTSEPLLVADLRGWTIGGAFEPVTERDDLIEIRLPAEGPAASAGNDDQHDGDENVRGDSALRAE